MLIAVFGLLNSAHIEQGIYALLEYFFPVLLVLNYKYINKGGFDVFVKAVCFIGLAYAIIAIVSVSNYATILDFIGTDAGKYDNYSQVRASFMLGSSITVSYFLTLVLPIVYYAFFECDDSKKKDKFKYSMVILAISLAVIMLQSRAAFACLAVTTVSFQLFYKTSFLSKIKIGVFVIGFLYLTSIIYSTEFEFNFFQRMSMEANNSSNIERFSSMYYGMEAMAENILLGTGMGQTFPRLAAFKELNLSGGWQSLIDPHNTLIMCLNEQGVVGLLLFCLLFYNVYKQFSNIYDINIRFLAKNTLVIYLLGAMGGSQIFNEVSFAIVFWWMLGNYMSFARLNKGEFIKNESNGHYLS